MKRRRIDDPKLENGFFVKVYQSFEKHFLRMLIHKYLALDDVFTLRACKKEWKQIIDDCKSYWEVYFLNLYRSIPLPNIRDVAICSLQNIHDGQVRQMQSILRISLPFCTKMTRKILLAYFMNSNEHRECLINCFPASMYNNPHPASSGADDFFLNVWIDGSKHRFEVFCVEGQAIFVRIKAPNYKFKPVRVTELVKKYRDGLQYYRN